MDLILKKEEKFKTLKISFILMSLFWTIIISILIYFNINQVYSSTYEIVKSHAIETINRDLIYRRWSALHGGVYVYITDSTQPNPYLSFLPDRDITTTTGKKLTLINPAYMTRQVHELAQKEYDSKGHITSLKPIRPQNKADEWETTALKSFEKGNKEFYDVVKISSKEYFRFMKPLITEASCLACHKSQGYNVGDIRGGISISIPWAPINTTLINRRNNIQFSYGSIWLIGLFGFGFVYSVLKKNINKQITIERELRDKQKQLTEAIATKDKFFSIIAHDLRSPFNNIIGYSQILVDTINRDKQENLKRFADIILSSSLKAFNLLENLILWARSQMGNIQFNPTKNFIGKIILENIDLVKDNAEKKSIKLLYNNNEDKEIDLDKEMINTVLRNLLNNAIKFTPINGIVEIILKTIADEVIICIKDSGIGMSKDMINDLFQLGKDVSRAGTNGEKSNGLGLILCKEFIDKHEGKIWVEAEIGKGSSFYFSLPINK